MEGDEQNTFKILVATDLHVGYKHQDPITGADSLNTFEEILQLALEHQVDFLLLGGDLFHDNRPSRTVIFDCMQLLNKYCLKPNVHDASNRLDNPNRGNSANSTFRVIRGADEEERRRGWRGNNKRKESDDEEDHELRTWGATEMVAENRGRKRKTHDRDSCRDSLTGFAHHSDDDDDDAFFKNMKAKYSRRKYGDGRQSEMNTDPSRSATSITTTTKRYNLADFSLPVFTIHGNHDEPTGPRQLSVLDLLASSGLVTYFGRTSPGSEVRVRPLLLQKGTSRLALYGIGYMRSNKLSSKFKQGKVVVESPCAHNNNSSSSNNNNSSISNRINNNIHSTATTSTAPEEDSNADDWFKLLVLHQNRVARPGDDTHIEDRFLDGLADLVIWGHEHACKIKPTPARTDNSDNEALSDNSPREPQRATLLPETSRRPKRTMISQPGSTISTQFTKEESQQKKVGLLKIRGKEFTIEPLSLQTNRQMYVEDAEKDLGFPRGRGDNNTEQRDSNRGNNLRREDTLILDRADQLREYCRNAVERTLARAEQTRGPRQPKEPLVRIKVPVQDPHDFFSNARFGAEFAGKVANPHSIVAFGTIRNATLQPNLRSPAENAYLATLTLEELLVHELRKEPEGLRIVPETEEVIAAVKEFVEIGNQRSDVVGQVFQKRLMEIQRKLKADRFTDGDLDTQTIQDGIRRWRERESGTVSQAHASTSRGPESPVQGSGGSPSPGKTSPGEGERSPLLGERSSIQGKQSPGKGKGSTSLRIRSRTLKKRQEEYDDEEQFPIVISDNDDDDEDMMQPDAEKTAFDHYLSERGSKPAQVSSREQSRENPSAPASAATASFSIKLSSREQSRQNLSSTSSAATALSSSSIKLSSRERSRENLSSAATAYSSSSSSTSSASAGKAATTTDVEMASTSTSAFNPQPSTSAGNAAPATGVGMASTSTFNPASSTSAGKAATATDVEMASASTSEFNPPPTSALTPNIHKTSTDRPPSNSRKRASSSEIANEPIKKIPTLNLDQTSRKLEEEYAGSGPGKSSSSADLSSSCCMLEEDELPDIPPVNSSALKEPTPQTTPYPKILSLLGKSSSPQNILPSNPPPSPQLKNSATRNPKILSLLNSQSSPQMPPRSEPSPSPQLKTSATPFSKILSLLGKQSSPQKPPRSEQYPSPQLKTSANQNTPRSIPPSPLLRETAPDSTPSSKSPPTLLKTSAHHKSPKSPSSLLKETAPAPNNTPHSKSPSLLLKESPQNTTRSMPRPNFLQKESPAQNTPRSKTPSPMLRETSPDNTNSHSKSSSLLLKDSPPQNTPPSSLLKETAPAPDTTPHSKSRLSLLKEGKRLRRQADSELRSLDGSPNMSSVCDSTTQNSPRSKVGESTHQNSPRSKSPSSLLQEGECLRQQADSGLRSTPGSSSVNSAANTSDSQSKAVRRQLEFGSIPTSRSRGDCGDDVGANHNQGLSSAATMHGSQSKAVRKPLEYALSPTRSRGGDRGDDVGPNHNQGDDDVGDRDVESRDMDVAGHETHIDVSSDIVGDVAGGGDVGVHDEDGGGNVGPVSAAVPASGAVSTASSADFDFDGDLLRGFSDDDEDGDATVDDGDAAADDDGGDAATAVDDGDAAAVDDDDDEDAMYITLSSDDEMNDGINIDDGNDISDDAVINVDKVINDDDDMNDVEIVSSSVDSSRPENSGLNTYYVLL